MESTESLNLAVNNFCQARGIAPPEIAALLAAVEANDADAIWLALADLSVPAEFYEDLVTAIYDNFTDFARDDASPNDTPPSLDASIPQVETNNVTSDALAFLDEDYPRDYVGLHESPLENQNSISNFQQGKKEVWLDLPGFVGERYSRNFWVDAPTYSLSKDKRRRRSFGTHDIRSRADAIKAKSYFSEFLGVTGCHTEDQNDESLKPMEIAGAVADSYETWRDVDDRALIRTLRKICRMRRVTNHLQEWPEDHAGAKEIAKTLVYIPNSELLMDCAEWGRGDWEEIADRYCLLFKLRSADDIRARFVSILAPWVRRSPWTSEEDTKLKFVAEALQERDWVEISRRLGTNRSPFACLARYRQVISPPPRKATWGKSEDDALKEAVHNIGLGRWQEVALCVGGRTSQQCLHRWRKLTEPSSKRKGRWSIDEVEALKRAVASAGRNWAKVAEMVDGRSEVQCREKWVNTLDSSVRKDTWTSQEDEKLKKAVEMHGLGKWSQVAKCVGGRTDNQCWRRWKIIHRTIKKQGEKIPQKNKKSKS